MFLDEHTITVIAGKGGDGCSSFRREKFVAKGGPNGGDGGSGGDVIIRANSNLNTLSHMAHKKVFKANKGVHGKGKNMHGKNAEPLIIEVPPGTIISEGKNTLIDLKKARQEVTVAKGGKGGLGNARFASSTNQAPRFAETGEPGEEKELKLELKLVADIGIIGLPSAGKSTLISVISNAKPKIAEYHFTTLAPNLGVVNMQKFGGSKEQTMVVADIPGLIEGASEGKGLGHQFLKHVSRTKLLIHVLDGTLPNIKENFQTINSELKKFSTQLSKLPQIIAINKIDSLSPEQIKEAKKELRKRNIHTISALTQTGLKELMHKAFGKLQELNEQQQEEEVKTDETVAILKPHQEQVQFEITKITGRKGNKTFHVSGKRINQLISMTDVNNQEGLERVYHFFHKMGIQKAVEKKGATFGDKIKINEKSIPYRK